MINNKYTAWLEKSLRCSTNRRSAGVMLNYIILECSLLIFKLQGRNFVKKSSHALCSDELKIFLTSALCPFLQASMVTVIHLVSSAAGMVTTEGTVVLPALVFVSQRLSPGPCAWASPWVRNSHRWFWGGWGLSLRAGVHIHHPGPWQKHVYVVCFHFLLSFIVSFHNSRSHSGDPDSIAFMWQEV